MNGDINLVRQFLNSRPLAQLVAKYITPEILAAIAREYGKGRVLQIGTTDLDAGRAVTWSMGAIAASGAPGALELFRKIMVASTSIHGAVSPVMIDVDVDGKRFQEMHVDGGVITAELARVEATLRDDPSITALVNNAGTASVAPLLNADVEKMQDMIALNVTALTRLTY